jgi:uncharacterized repeat protein (TIGR02543 family)
MSIKQHKINCAITKCLSILFILMLLGTTVFIVHGTSNLVAAFEDEDYDEVYYVSADGDNVTGDGSQANPWASLSRTVEAVHDSAGNNYLVYVMTDLTLTNAARYYDNRVTITSLGDTPFTVTRAQSTDGGVTPGVSTLPEFVGGVTRYYNPAMVEIEGGSESVPAALTLGNIIFDDAYRHEGTNFAYRGATNTASYVQSAIVASHSPYATIILGFGAELRNFGGMSAVNAWYGATLIMESGSLIRDVGANGNTRAVSTSATNGLVNGEAAVSVATGSAKGGFYMYDGARITGIANAHGVKLSGHYKCFIDGEIDNLVGNKGSDTSGSASDSGRGPKNAIFFSNGGTTYDPNTGDLGSAVVGSNANIHHNAVKCGAICVSRSPNVSVKIYGKVNYNKGGTGSTFNMVGTNGGGLYLVAGGTMYLEDGCEIIGNSVTGGAYGGAASIQQGGSRLIMNGGTIFGNTAPAAVDAGIVVNRDNARFEMNGGDINNGNTAVYLKTDSPQTNGNIILNAGSISGVTIQNTNVYGAISQRHLFIDKDNVKIGTNYVNVAGRQVYPLQAGFRIGNPNQQTYANIRSSLPQGWTMPSVDSNVIGFWVQKTGSTAVFSVPVPTTGSAPNSYDLNLGVYIAAVQATISAGVADTTVPVKFYPTTIVNGRIVVSVPLNTYPNGATVALVQPTTDYGEIVFEGPDTLTFDISASEYPVSYTATYTMPPGLHEALRLDLHDNSNTVFTFTVHPDFRTTFASLSLVSSDIFEMSGYVWDPISGEFVVTLKLINDWTVALDFDTVFTFDCGLPAVNFDVNDFLRLTGDFAIVGQGQNYLVYSNEAQTQMIMLKGGLQISKILLGNAVDSTKDFHFTVAFSPEGIFGGVVVESVSVSLKGGESETIVGIPRGVQYVVVETDANQNGYTTMSTGASGIISDDGLSEAIFTNTKNNPTEIETEYTVTYRGNGNSGGVAPVDSKWYLAGDRVIVLGQGSLVRSGYVFLGWSTNTQATTPTYTTGATFTIQNSDVVLYAVWSPILYTVTYQPGAHGTFTPQSTSGLRYGDATPTAPTVIGETGWTFTGWSPTPSTTVTGDATYVAQWTQTTTTTTPPPTTSTPSPTQTPTPSADITPEPTPTPSQLQTPTLSPTSTGPPITEENEISMPVWALVNLVLSITGVILAIIVAIVCILSLTQKKKKKQEDTQKDIKNTNATKQNDKQDSEKQQRQHRTLWLITTIAMGIVGVVVFLLTEDMRLPMVMVDKWTVVNVIVFIVELIAMVFVFKRKDDSEKQAKTEVSKSNTNLS